MVANFHVWEPYIEGYEFASALEPVNLPIETASAIAVGAPVRDVPGEILFAGQTAGPVPDVMSTGGSGLLLSENIVQAISDLCSSAKVRFIPARLGESPAIAKWLLHVETVLPCVDRKTSVLTYFADYPEGIDGISRLDPLPLANAPALFHMAEIVTTLIVREDLRLKMEALSSSCGRFVRLDLFKRDATG